MMNGCDNFIHKRHIYTEKAWIIIIINIIDKINIK